MTTTSTPCGPIQLPEPATKLDPDGVITSLRKLPSSCGRLVSQVFDKSQIDPAWFAELTRFGFLQEVVPNSVEHVWLREVYKVQDHGALYTINPRLSEFQLDDTLRALESMLGLQKEAISKTGDPVNPAKLGFIAWRSASSGSGGSSSSKRGSKRTAIEASPNYIEGNYAHEPNLRKMFLMTLAERAAMLKMQRVPSWHPLHDPRLPSEEQHGCVIAQRRIQAGEFMPYVYCGLLVPADSNADVTMYDYATFKWPFQEDGSKANLTETQRFVASAYLYGFEGPAAQYNALTTRVWGGQLGVSHTGLSIDALLPGLRNEAAYFNDPRNMMQVVPSKGPHHQEPAQANIAPRVGFILGLPVICFQAMQTIEAGQEIFLSYGEGYWIAAQRNQEVDPKSTQAMLQARESKAKLDAAERDFRITQRQVQSLLSQKASSVTLEKCEEELRVKQQQVKAAHSKLAAKTADLHGMLSLHKAETARIGGTGGKSARAAGMALRNAVMHRGLSQIAILPRVIPGGTLAAKQRSSSAAYDAAVRERRALDRRRARLERIIVRSQNPAEIEQATEQLAAIDLPAYNPDQTERDDVKREVLYRVLPPRLWRRVDADLYQRQCPVDSNHYMKRKVWPKHIADCCVKQALAVRDLLSGMQAAGAEAVAWLPRVLCPFPAHDIDFHHALLPGECLANHMRWCMCASARAKIDGLAAQLAMKALHRASPPTPLSARLGSQLDPATTAKLQSVLQYSSTAMLRKSNNEGMPFVAVEHLPPGYRDRIGAPFQVLLGKEEVYEERLPHQWPAELPVPLILPSGSLGVQFLQPVQLNPMRDFRRARELCGIPTSSADDHVLSQPLNESAVHRFMAPAVRRAGIDANATAAAAIAAAGGDPGQQAMRARHARSQQLSDILDQQLANRLSCAWAPVPSAPVQQTAQLLSHNAANLSCATWIQELAEAAAVARSRTRSGEPIPPGGFPPPALPPSSLQTRENPYVAMSRKWASK